MSSLMMLPEDESFSLQANITSPGFQGVVLRGFITQRRGDGVYAAPLLPQLFYGADGNQLQTWRQFISTTGQQTILSRSGGEPSLPREELAWRKISDRGVPTREAPAEAAVPNYLRILIPVAMIGTGIAIFYLVSR